MSEDRYGLAVKVFKVVESADSEVPSSGTLTLEDIEKKQAARQRKRMKGAQAFVYRDTAHVIPTSNLVERLFSKAKHILTDDRKRMEPRRLEEVLYLQYNQ